MIAPVFALPALCACDLWGDPAGETPVQMQSGLYEVTLGGATLIRLRSGTRTDRICLTSYDASQFPRNPLDFIIEPWADCGPEIVEPIGNSIKGARRCATRKVPMIAAYTGRHTTDTFEVDGMITQGQGETASIMRLGSGEFSLKGERIGDCSPR